jgi:hypothetical protein
MHLGQGDSHADASEKSAGQRRIYGLAQFWTSNFGQISQSYADNESRFDPFAKRDYESLQHFLTSAFDFENEFQFQYQG